MVESAPGNEYMDDFTVTADGRLLVMSAGLNWLHAWRRKKDGWRGDWSVDTDAWYWFALAPAGDRLAHVTRSGGRDGKQSGYALVIRSAATGDEEARGNYPYRDHAPLQFRPEGKQVIAITDATIAVWPVPEPGEPKVVQNDTKKPFTGVAFDPSNRYLFAASDTSVRVWDTATWEVVKRFTWKIGSLQCVAFSPDGTLAAAGNDKGRVVVWDVDL